MASRVRGKDPPHPGWSSESRDLTSFQKKSYPHQQERFWQAWGLGTLGMANRYHSQLVIISPCRTHCVYCLIIATDGVPWYANHHRKPYKIDWAVWGTDFRGLKERTMNYMEAQIPNAWGTMGVHVLTHCTWKVLKDSVMHEKKVLT